MTQFEAARADQITPEMKFVAQREDLPEELIRAEVARGRMVIPANRVHLTKRLEPMGIGVAALTKTAKHICKAAGGRTLPASITRIIHAQPWVPPDSILGPKGERWIPVHCIVPLSGAVDIVAAVQDLYERYKDRTTAQNIRTGFLLVTVGNYGFLIEPVFFWPDARLAMYDKTMRPEHLARLPTHPANEAARATVLEMRTALAELFAAKGAVSFQIGKFYFYDRSRLPAAWDFLKRVKALVDPKGLMNPGALKL